MNGLTSSRSPWWWVPSLYFAEGIPYFMVNNISVTMFTRMGVPNGEMALFTSLIYLPWMIKPFWSPFVDIIRTKRWWIVAMQILMSAAFILLTLSIPHPATTLIAEKQVPVSMFTLTLIFFVLTAFASATHDIAADGFYMLANDKEQQSFFVRLLPGTARLHRRLTREKQRRHTHGLADHRGARGRHLLPRHPLALLCPAADQL